MKNTKLLLTTVLMLSCATLFAQTETVRKVESVNQIKLAPKNNLQQKVSIIQGNYLGVSVPLRDLPQVYDESQMVYEHDEGDVKANRKRPEAVNPNALPKGEDPARQKDYPKADNDINLGVNFNGLGGAFPPDPSGAVSPDYYVQAVNTAYRVYNKDGTSSSGAMALNTLWPGSNNSGDPIVMWDRHAEKFVITQFQTGSNKILFAISTTTDPLGTFHLYEFSFPSFPDYPKYSIWSDGYYMTSNTYTQNVVAFEREKMIAGDPSASMIALNLPSFSTGYGFRSVLPADADGDLPPYGTPMNLFLFQDDSWGGVSEDHIRVLEMEVDWDTPSNSSISLKQNIPTDPFNSVFTNSWDDITQKGTSQKIDAIASVFNFRAQYLRWPGYNTLVLCNVVDVNNNNVGGIRWYELRQTADTLDWEIHQQSTYAPADGASRFIGSISMDYNGHIGLAYSISGPNHYPGLAFTGRYWWHSLGDMALPETMAIDGQYFQSGGNRFGDYSHMALDPDGQTFWFTGEYIGSGGSRRTRIFSFNLESQVEIEGQEVQKPELILSQSGDQIIVEGMNLPGDEKMKVELFAVNGQLLASTEQTVLNGELKASFGKASLNSGVYLVRIGKENFQRVKKIAVTK
ncbi:MAG: T9SS type A sorting domain-containing protein [Brumimicrobium sp.]|nr:T9SS type A sorting domain-containing protein [Brumimicrobium sp.]